MGRGYYPGIYTYIYIYPYPDWLFVIVNKYKSQEGHRRGDRNRRTNVTMEDWNNMATSQEILTASRKSKRRATDFPLELSGASSDNTLFLFP